MRLEIRYWSEKGIDASLDNSIEEALKPLGFERYASGMETKEGGARDIAFDRPNEE